MAKAYIIMEKGFEYNDEIYSEPESGGGTAQHVYTDIDLANREMDRLERGRWRGEQPGNYSYDLDGISDYTEEEIALKLAELFSLKTPAKSKRKQELYAKLTGTLTGIALEAAVIAALDSEFPDKDELGDKVRDWVVPSWATDSQVDEVRKIFNSLSFFEIQTVDID